MLIVIFVTWILFACATLIKGLAWQQRSFLMMGGILAYEFGQGLVTALCHHTAPISVEHLGERLALFVIIHLGETMFSITETFFVLQGMWDYEYYQSYIIVMGGLLSSYSFLRVYFEVEADEPKLPHALKRNHITHYLFCLFHHILCIAIISTAIGIKGLHELQVTILDNKYSSKIEIKNLTITNVTLKNIVAENITSFYSNMTQTELDEKYPQFCALFCFGAVWQIFSLLLLQWISETREKAYLISPLNHHHLIAKFIVTFLRLFVMFVVGIIYLARNSFNPFGIVIWVSGVFVIWSLCEGLIDIDEKEHRIENFEELDAEREEFVDKLRKEMGMSAFSTESPESLLKKAVSIKGVHRNSSGLKSPRKTEKDL